MTQSRVNIQSISYADGAPYFSIFDVKSDFSFPVEFKVTDYPGLTLCHVTTATSRPRLVAYWRTESAFRAYEAAFSRNLALQTPESSGFAVDIRQPKVVWWKPKSLSAIVLAVAATFGGLSALRDYFAALFALPEVTLSYSDANRIDSVEGEQVSAKLTAVSGVRFVPESVLFDTVRVQTPTGQAIQMQMEPPALPNLIAGQPQVMIMTGTAPAHSGKQGEPDVYQLNVFAKARAGMITGLFGGQRSSVPGKAIWIWSNKPGLQQLKLGRHAGGSCEFLGELYSPRAYATLNLEVKSESNPGEVVSLNATTEGGMSSTPEASANRTVFIAAVELHSLEKFRLYPYRVFLDLAKQVDTGSCELWKNKLRITAK